MNRDDFVSYLRRFQRDASDELERLEKKFPWEDRSESVKKLIDKLDYDICYIEHLINNLPLE